MNYLIKTANPIARAGVIRKLMAKGYKLAGANTVSTYFTEWPAAKYPYVLVLTDGSFLKTPMIDLRASAWKTEDRNLATVQWNLVHMIPTVSELANAKENQVVKSTGYIFRCSSAEERTALINSLTLRGYKLWCNILELNNRTYANSLTICAQIEDKVASIHTASLGYSNPDNLLEMSVKEVELVPYLPGHTEPSKPTCFNGPKPVSAPVLPESSKYTLVYQQGDGKVEAYTVSNPIESNSDLITCYAFSKGVRSFKRGRIVSFEKVK